MFSFIFLISQKICLESLIKERIISFAKYWKLRLLWPKNKVKSLFFFAILPFFLRFLAKTSGEHHKKSQLGLFFGTLLLNIYFTLFRGWRMTRSSCRQYSARSGCTSCQTPSWCTPRYPSRCCTSPAPNQSIY